MRKFTFKLERLLSFRKILTDQERGRLANSVASLNVALDEANQLINIRESTISYRDEKLRSGVEAGEVVNLHGHLQRIEESISFAQEKVDEARDDVRKSTEALVEKKRDEKALEIVKSRRFSVWLRDYYRDEGKILDDIGTMKYLRDSEASD